MAQGFFQLAIALAILLAVAPLLGRYMARVFMGQRTVLDPISDDIGVYGFHLNASKRL